MRTIVIAVLVVTLVLLPAYGAAAAPLPASGPDLAAVDAVADGAEVRFTGEVVSEPLAGGEGHVWLNVLSEGTAIGLWMDERDAASLESFGDWGHSGDTISVVGVYNVACDMHGGDLDVHVTSAEWLDRGAPREHPAQLWKLVVGAGAGLAAYTLGRRTRRVEEREGL